MMCKEDTTIFCMRDCGNKECKRNKEYYKNMTEFNKSIIVQNFNKCEDWKREDKQK